LRQPRQARSDKTETIESNVGRIGGRKVLHDHGVDKKHHTSQLTFPCNIVAGYADYAHFASRNLKYFGFKLVARSTLNGIPVVYKLVLDCLDVHLVLKLSWMTL